MSSPDGTKLRASQTWVRSLVTHVGDTNDGQLNKTVLFALGLRAVHHVVLGADLGLWEALSHGADTPAGLAARLALRPAAVDAWCELGCLLEYLQADPDGRLSLRPTVREILCETDGPRYLVPFLRLVAESVQGGAALYPDAFRTGRRILRHERAGARAAIAIREMSRLINREFLDSVLPAVPRARRLLERGARVLELGCGSAELLIELVRRYPRARFCGVDQDPYAIQLAEAAAAAAKIGGRSRFVIGDALESDWGGPFDLVLMVGFLHEIEPGSFAALASRCGAALSSGGMLLLREFPRPPHLSAADMPEYAQAVTIDWMEVAEHGRCLTPSEQEDFMRSVGLGDVERHVLHLPTGDFGACLSGVKA